MRPLAAGARRNYSCFGMGVYPICHNRKDCLAAHSVIPAINAVYAVIALLVEQTLNDFVDAISHIGARWVHHIVPIVHTFAYVPWQIHQRHAQAARQAHSLVAAHLYPCGAVISIIKVIGLLGAYYQFASLIDAYIHVLHNLKVVVGANYCAGNHIVVAYPFVSHFILLFFKVNQPETLRFRAEE